MNYSPILKRTPASKRAAAPRVANYAKSFLKDWERLSRSGRYDLTRLKAAMLLLIANDGPLAAEWLDHPEPGEAGPFRLLLPYRGFFPYNRYL
jgi:mRNA interferase YafQ